MRNNGSLEMGEGEGGGGGGYGYTLVREWYSTKI